MKILYAKFSTGNASFSIPLKEAENRFSISCLVCATEQSQKSTFWGKNIRCPLIYFEEYSLYLCKYICGVQWGQNYLIVLAW